MSYNSLYKIEQQIYSWSKYTPLSNVKVVILGQDPYHGPNQAHGLCFSVRKGIQIPPSLQNIYKAIQTDYPDFKIPNHGYLENWAKQGVLMLNTSLTVRRSEAGSHSNAGWEQLTDAIITHLNEKKANIVFMLWGAHAQRKGAKIDKKVKCRFRPCATVSEAHVLLASARNISSSKLSILPLYPLIVSILRVVDRQNEPIN